MEQPTQPLVGWIYVIPIQCLSCWSFHSSAESDYRTTTFTLTFEPSRIGQRLCGNVPIIDDNVGLEPNKLFSVRITSVTNAVIGDSESCVEIIDDDGMTRALVYQGVATPH